MFAVFEYGGKQYQVRKNQTVRLEKIPSCAGTTIVLNKILMVVDHDVVHIGRPYVKRARITADVVGHIKENKIRIVKMRRRKHFRKHQGHRQRSTCLRILDIVAK